MPAIKRWDFVQQLAQQSKDKMLTRHSFVSLNSEIHATVGPCPEVLTSAISPCFFFFSFSSFLFFLSFLVQPNRHI